MQLDEEGQKFQEMDLLVTETQTSDFQLVISSQTETNRIVGIMWKGDKMTFMETSSEPQGGFIYRYLSVLKSDKNRISLGPVEVDQKTNRPLIKAVRPGKEIGSIETINSLVSPKEKNNPPEAHQTNTLPTAARPIPLSAHQHCHPSRETSATGT